MFSEPISAALSAVRSPLAQPKASQKIVRALDAKDIEAYEVFVSHLSSQTRRWRLLGGAINPSRELMLTALHSQIGQSAVIGIFEANELVGVGRYALAAADLVPTKAAALHNPRAAEFAVTVRDDRQGFGLGTTLLKTIRQKAMADRYEVLVALTLYDNEAMLGLARGQGMSVTTIDGPDGLSLIQSPLTPNRIST